MQNDLNSKSYYKSENIRLDHTFFKNHSLFGGGPTKKNVTAHKSLRICFYFYIDGQKDFFIFLEKKFFGTPFEKKKILEPPLKKKKFSLPILLLLLGY